MKKKDISRDINRYIDPRFIQWNLIFEPGQLDNRSGKAYMKKKDW